MSAIQMPASNTSMFKIIQHLAAGLFAAEHRRLDKAIASLITRNNEATGITAAGFLYYGEYYTATGFQTSPGAPKVTLHESLDEAMKWYLTDSTTIANDEAMIRQGIFKVTSPCESLQEMRDALPDCLSKMVPALAILERHNQVGYSLRGDVRGERQFMELLPKIEMYSAARLLY